MATSFNYLSIHLLDGPAFLIVYFVFTGFEHGCSKPESNTLATDDCTQHKVKKRREFPSKITPTLEACARVQFVSQCMVSPDDDVRTSKPRD